jgi:hypothetical protein
MRGQAAPEITVGNLTMVTQEADVPRVPGSRGLGAGTIARRRWRRQGQSEVGTLALLLDWHLGRSLAQIAGLEVRLWRIGGLGWPREGPSFGPDDRARPRVQLGLCAAGEESPFDG